MCTKVSPWYRLSDAVRTRETRTRSSARQRLTRWMTGCVMVMCVGAISAQEFRATVTGRVTDPDGLAIPGVVITATNTQTNETAATASSEQGAYSLPFLKPGIYTITAELEGFRKHTQEKVELQVGQTITLPIQLQVGALTEIVTVVSETVEGSKADRGMVVDNKRVTELPLNARNPFELSTLSPGITKQGNAIYQRPFDNGAIADWSINGGQNRNNEFLLDGAPNNSIQGGNNLAYVPPVDSVQEFKIITNSYDAQYGRTAGGVVNVSLKSGTNVLHGTVYEFARRKFLDSREYFHEVNNQDKPNHKLDQYGFQIDGPVKIPGLYDGTNKTFFMFNYEGYKELTPNPATLTFPDDAQISGDFSNLRDRNGNLITIYDPSTGRMENGRFVRDPFPGNRIPQDRINPMAQQILRLYPKPNTTTPGADPWRDNFLFSPNLADDTFYNIATKVDQNISDKSRLFVRYAQNKRTETRFSNGILSGPAQDGQLPLERLNYTGVADWVRTGAKSVVLNVRVGLNQYLEEARTEAGLGFDPTELGFPSSLASQLPHRIFPRFEFYSSGTTREYTQMGRANFNSETTTVLSVQPNVSMIKGKHNIRAGLDARFTWYTRELSGQVFEITTDRRFTQEDWDRSDPLSGNSIASFLLGAPSGGAINNNLFPQFRWNYYAPWIQDDWQISDRLTLNLGLRWDLNSPVFEVDDRVNYGFDTETINPVSGRIDQTRFPGYQVRGGLGFAGVNGNPTYPYQFDRNNIQPRVGFAYFLNERTIMRGGYGRMFLNVTGTTVSNGFSISTPLVASADGGRTPLYTLNDPFPIVSTPAGSALGLETFLGRSPNFSNPDYENPYVDQFSLSIQRMLPWRTSIELSYVGSRTKKQQTSWDGFNNPPAALRDQCDPTRGGNPAFCDEQIPNPFFQVPGFEGTSRFTNPTLSRYELSRPFPQFGSIEMFERNDGRIWYNSAQVVVNKRFSDGLTLNGTYTFSKSIEESGFMDATLQTIQRSVYFADRPHRVTLSGVYELPFGNGRRFLGGATGPLNVLVSGWEIAGSWLFNSGRPWELPGNVYYVEGAQNPNVNFSDAIIRGVMPCVARMENDGKTLTMLAYSVAAGCSSPNFIVRPSYSPRDAPFRDDHIRRPPFYQFDMNFAKTTRLVGNTRLQFRLEVFNVLNQPMYDERDYVRDTNSADFGTINRNSTRQSNFPRQIQLGIKFLW